MKYVYRLMTILLIAILLQGPILWCVWNVAAASEEAIITEVKKMHIPGTRKTRHDMYKYRYESSSFGESISGWVYAKYTEGDEVNARMTFVGLPMLAAEKEAALVNSNALLLLLTVFGLIYVIRKKGGN